MLCCHQHLVSCLNKTCYTTTQEISYHADEESVILKVFLYPLEVIISGYFKKFYILILPYLTPQRENVVFFIPWTYPNHLRHCLLVSVRNDKSFSFRTGVITRKEHLS